MIIAINGKINSGKDTVGKIIQYLDVLNQSNGNIPIGFSLDTLNSKVIESTQHTTWKVKKFADKLKDIVCILLGCTREKLEDREFKEKELGEEWRVYKYCIMGEMGAVIKTIITVEPDTSNVYWIDGTSYYKKFELSYILTPRLMLQLVGTECFRNIVHPNTWVNALMSGYDTTKITSDDFIRLDVGSYYIPSTKLERKWIITDLRFPNELEAVKKRKGICITIIRPGDLHNNVIQVPKHESETALDHITDWNYEIVNDGSIEDLIEKVKIILKLEDII